MAATVNVINDSQRVAARVAALAFPISMAALAYVTFGVRGSLVSTADPAERVRLIAAAEPLYRLSVGLDLVFCVGFLVLLTALYVILSPVNRYVALLASVSKLVYTVTAMLLALSFLSAVNLASNPAYLQSLGEESVHALVKLNSSASWDQYYVGLVFWAFSSTLFGWLWLKSRYIPTALALFGLVSSAWCLFCAGAYIMYPAFSTVVNVWLFDMPMALFYVTLSGWLLFKGLRGAPAPVA